LNEALRRVAKDRAAWLRLQAATLFVKGDGVEVESLAGRRAKNEPNRKVVFMQSEALRIKSCLDALNVDQRNDQVEILVLACLAPEQRINTPPTVEHSFDASRAQVLE
jgi:hypothetical protein